MKIITILLLLVTASLVILLVADPLSMLRQRDAQKHVVCFSGGSPIFSGMTRGDVAVEGVTVEFFSVDLGTDVTLTNARCMFVEVP